MPAVRDAMVVLIKSYDALGMTQLRDDAQRVLSSTYGDNAELKFSSEDKSPGGSSGNKPRITSKRLHVQPFDIEGSSATCMAPARQLSVHLSGLLRRLGQLLQGRFKLMRTAQHPHGRQCGNQLHAIAFVQQARIAHHQYPRSVSLRIKRPAPCLSAMAASGSM